MPNHTRFAAAEGLLRSVAVALVPWVSAMALMFTPGQAMAMLLQNSQQLQPMPGQPALHSQRSEISQQNTKPVAVSGTIVKNGSDFVLKEPSGTVYRLDDPEKPEPFEGKSVTVTGQLDADSSLIHVESIEVMTA
jgi:hypothetical protein